MFSVFLGTVVSVSAAQIIEVSSPSSDCWTISRDVEFHVSVSDPSSIYTFIDWDDSLVGWWRGEGGATDSSPSGINGTASETTSYISGKFGQCFAGGPVTIGDADQVDFRLAADFTISCWVSISDATAWRDILTKGSYFKLFYKSDSSRWQFNVGNSSSYVYPYYTQIGSPVGSWVHLAATYSAGTRVLALYANGASRSSATLSLSQEFQTTNSFVIASSAYVSVDEVLVFNRALGGTEIAALYDAKAGGLSASFTVPEIVEYSYQVWAVNAGGDVSSESGSITVDVPNSSPTGSVTNPISPRRTSASSMTFTGTARDANADTTLSLATLWWDVGQTPGTLVSSGLTDALGGNSDTWSIEASGLTAGTIIWNIKLKDSAGNEGWLGSDNTLIVGQSVFYVSPSGNDSNPGTLGEPFLTIQHFADNCYPGDTCYIRAGTYRETVTPVRGGNASAAITFQAYNGETVTISGADVITGTWTLHEGSVYRIAHATDLGLGNNQVFVNGVSMMEARWPNPAEGYWQSRVWEENSIGLTSGGSISGSTVTILSSDITQGANTWVGALVHGYWDYCGASGIVTASDTGTLTFTSHTATGRVTPAGGSAHFFFIAGNSYHALDIATEWYYDYDGTIGDAGTLYFWAPGGVNPNTLTVEAKTRQHGFDFSGISHIFVQGIDLFGCNVVTNAESSHVTLTDLDAKYISHFMVLDKGRTDQGTKGVKDSGIVFGGSHHTLQNASIDWSAGNGVSLWGSDSSVLDCTITNVGYAMSGCCGVHSGRVKSSHNRINGNTISKTSRGSIEINNLRAAEVKHNTLSYTRYSGSGTWDLGAIYAMGTDGQGTEIAYNVLHDIREIGIYLDNRNWNYHIHHNLAYDWGGYDNNVHIGLHMNQVSQGHRIHHNTFVDGYISTNRINVSDGLSMAGTEIKNNICRALRTVGSARFTGYPDSADDAVLGNNIYTSTTDPTTLFRNYAGKDFRLREGTVEAPNPAINAGENLGYTQDIVGHPHNSPPDIGAYQYWDGVAPATYTLSVAAEHGVVSKSPDRGEYSSGESVSLEAVPAAGYNFAGWSGDLSGSSNPATLVMDGNKSVTAVFASNVHTLTIAASGGTVTKSPDKASYEYGESVTLTASADAGHSFTGWSGAASGTDSSVTIVMDGDKSVTANFAAISYTLSIAAMNGSVAASPQKAGYSYNESVSLQAVPGTGYHFTGWSGSLSGSSNPASIVMNADKSVTAAFAVNTYTLTTSATNGSVVKSPQAASYTHGSTVSLQAVAAEGYEFAGWSGAVSGSANPVEIVMDSSKSVTAAFTVKTYTLTTSATNGSVVRSPDSATYAHGSTVSVQAVAAEGYHFTGWSGAVSGSSNPVSLVMDASKSVTAAFAANAYTLSISAANGAVTASPSQATYTHGEVVTLTATPSTGYGFSSWSGDASGTAASTTVTMDGNKSVTAAFTLNTYTLSISSANGTVARDPEQATYTHGQTVTLTAVPATGYSFSSWSGDLSGTVASATITMDGNKSVAAGFTINSYTLNTSGANGSITKNPDKGTYNHGETVTLQAVPAEGYNFVNWSVDLAGSANPATLVMDSNKTVAATFAANTYTLQTTATNGSVTRTPDRASYTHGETVTLTAVPATGYSFSSWSGDLSGTAASVTITMSSNKSVAAGFTINSYTLNTSATNGSITKTPNQGTYTHGETVTLQAVPADGYNFVNWSGDMTGATSPTTLMMDSNKSVTAIFAANTYTLQTNATNGSVTRTPDRASYTHGETVTLTAVPTTGYSFSSWSGDITGTAASVTITMNSNKSVAAGFTINSYTLNTSAANGSITKNPNQGTYTHGETVTLHAVPAEGYNFVNWSGDLAGSTSPTTLVMDSNKSVTATFAANTYTLQTNATNGSVTRTPDRASYTHGETVILTAVPATGYSFGSWSGDASGTTATVAITMNANKSVTAGFTANAYTLSVSALNGTVTASPSQATYTHGQVVTLTAAPSAGYGFSSWSGDASGTAASTTVTMDSNKSVTAAFVLNTYTLNISSANGTVTKSPNQATYTHGQTVTVTAVPATGYSFSSWSGDLSGTVASATITMDGNKSVAAGFTINSYTLNTSGANGSITKNPDKSTYNHGETVTLQAVPAEGYNFVNWSGDLTGSANPATLVMDSNKTVAAAFATNTYTLQTNATNGSVTRTPDQASFAHGETVTLTAVPATGYSFSGWSGDASGSTATVAITMNADKSVTAGFTANAYTLSVSASNGSVTVNPIRATYAHGEVVTLTAVPSVGYSFASWSGDASGTATSTTVTMDSNKSVTAAFALNTYTLSVTSANGTVTKNPSQATYNHGDVVALTAEPAEGYEFAGWSGDLTGSSNPATLTMTSNKSVTAHFTAVSNDNEAPVLFGFSPLADAIQVPLNSLVLLRITDSGDGVDANTVSIRVNDNVVYAGNVASVSGDHGVCRRVGTPAHYVYAFQPVEDFDYDSTVAVTVNAADLAGNAMAQQSYSFRTQMRTFGSNHCASWGPDGLDKGGAATVCDAGGNVWVVWHAGDAGSRDIYISRLTSGQEQFSGPIQLTSNASDQCNPDIAIGPDGRLFVVWQDNRRGNWDIYLRTSADGVTWSSEAEATDFTNDETNPVIAVDARSPSYAYIAWQDNRAGNQDIYVASSSTHFASKTVACVTSNVQDQIGPRIAVDGANGVYLVWTDFRNGAADVYGAASSSGPWTNVAVATGVGSQSAPDIAAEPGGYSLHFVWVNRVDNQDDVFYGTSIGLPASPLAGINIIDDTSSADQRTPAIVAAGSGGTARVFAAWQDFRNAADGLDTDLYAAEIKDGSVTNLFVGDGWTRTNQTEPCIGVDLFGRPYVVWTDERNAKDEIYFAASTFVEPTPLDVRMVVGATGGTVGVASPTQLDDVSVVIPAGACAYDVTVSIARIWNLEPGLPADILPYEFGPSGLQFEAPVTITIPYAVADFPGDPPQPYWYDTMTGAMSQQGITNIQYVALSSTLHALRFQTTHFTPYAVVGEVEEGIVPTGGSSGGGGCSLSPAAAGASGAMEYFVPFTLLALAMVGLRIKDKRRHSKPR